MGNQRTRKSARKPLENQRRERISFAEAMSLANRRAHEQANRRSGRREMKSVRAAIDATAMDDHSGSVELGRRLMRWLVAVVLLPLCWVTTWTLLSRFSDTALQEDFWQAAGFWYFAAGVLVMAGWFWSGLMKSFFLYLYVLGHELTHAVCVWLFWGKVTDFHVSAGGGYITTNKTNLIIALSPYFVPFWAVISALAYLVLRVFANPGAGWDLAFYALMGVTWTFHMVWTLWMIPRDQPDLRENGRFLSLVVIYLANLLVLVGLLCLAEESPLHNTREFAMEWLRYAATWSDSSWRWLERMIAGIRSAGMF